MENKDTEELVQNKAPEMTAQDVVDIVRLFDQNYIDFYIDDGWGILVHWRAPKRGIEITRQRYIFVYITNGQEHPFVHLVLKEAGENENQTRDWRMAVVFVGYPSGGMHAVKRYPDTDTRCVCFVCASDARKI